MIFRASIHLLSAAMTSFIYGTLVGWSAPTLKKLREPDSPIHLTPAEEVQMINAIYAGTLLGTFPCGALMNRVGRKGSLLLLSAFPITSWSAIYFARTASMLLIARFFAGVWGAAAGTIRPIYVAEIAEPRVRGAAGAFTMVRLTFLPFLSIKQKLFWEFFLDRACLICT